jgi:predicted nucleic acid-binding protein
MTISIDSNVISALWNNDDPFNVIAAEKLDALRPNERLIVSGPVYSELMAGPLRDETSLNLFFEDTLIEVDWAMEEEMWREAGRANCGYIQRRRSSSGTLPRRMVTDFLIGAHALVLGYSLLTFDQRLYAASFPKLRIIAA